MPSPDRPARALLPAKIAKIDEAIVSAKAAMAGYQAGLTLTGANWAIRLGAD